VNSSAGAPEPLGVSLTAEGINIAVFSAHADAIHFCLFDDSGEREIARVALTGRTGDVFHGAVAGVSAGARYGFRADGPFAPERGHRFDASKLLADPHAALVDRPCKLHPAMFERGADSGAVAPKSIVAAMRPAVTDGHRIAWARTILYELNLRAFTRLHPEIPEALRGTFAGLAHPKAIAHLAGLGVTSVEIMPADAFVDERHLPPLGLTNAWGYNPVIVGAPDPRLSPGGWDEVRQAVEALHSAGLEVILDIVLNHSGESDEFGPTLSYRGLDNASYYRLAGDPARYVNDMGTGNCLALDRPQVMRVAIDGLRRWMTQGGVDGFRFDLATAMGRRDGGFDPHAPLIEALGQDPVLREAKLIAEPWDVGPGGYQLGRFPQGWGEWNDRYRDAARRYWRGDRGMRGEIATRIAGSRDVFGAAPTPSKSVNFITAHDGFTLRDLVSYDHKHNEANGEDNRDGSNDNCSWNNGAEGPTDDSAIDASRARDVRNLLALLLVSRGAPMLAMGSEIGHSQRGNNNAYAQDNAISWLDWSKADLSLYAFVRKLIAARQAHAALSADAFLTGRPFDASALPDVEWRGGEGELTSPQQWEEAEAPLLVAVFASPMEAGTDRVAIVLNRGRGEAVVQLPAARARMGWRVLIDASDGEAPERDIPSDDRVTAPARATLIIAEVAAPHRQPPIRMADAQLIDTLARTAGIAADWWDVAGNHTIVSRNTKIALLAALRLPASSHDEALESLRRIVEQREARAVPPSIVAREGAPLAVPLRSDAAAPLSAVELRIETEDGREIVVHSHEEPAQRRVLSDGREINERRVALPGLPVGRHRLIADGVACALTVAPNAAWLPEGAPRRFGFSAQLYAQRRVRAVGTSDQGIGDFTTLARLGEAAGRVGAATLGVNPLHVLFPGERVRASPYHPSDRRFLDPIHIDALDGAGLPSDPEFEALIAGSAEAIAAAASSASVEYESVWRLKEILLAGRWAAFSRARLARPNDPLFADYAKFVAEGGEILHRFAIFQAIAREIPGDWRNWPEELRRADPAALDKKAEEHSENVGFALFAQWLADRQLGNAAARAGAAGLELGLYRDLAVGSAPDGAEAWARAEELAQGASVGAPPDPFSTNGQIWHLPPPDPLAGAREGWRGLSALYAANMRHAGLLRIDHAMGLARLFVVPDGATPAEGAYLAYPIDELIGHIALESQRHKCMIVGEDLGTVPEGFRDIAARAGFLSTRVLWFERRDRAFIAPQSYPALAVACATTHDLPTLAGWWSGADLDERTGIGLLNADEAQRARAERAREKRELVDALAQSGLMAEPPDFDLPLPDAVAGAVHAFLNRTPSMLAMAQIDDLAGETVATNLPGTDRERPNWRHRLGLGVEALLSSGRARAIIEALAVERRASNPVEAIRSPPAG
jgi:glycogen debranching enzyme GlgX/4-alpha-glucanotransferase